MHYRWYKGRCVQFLRIVYDYPTYLIIENIPQVYLCTAVKALSIKVLTARKIVGEKEDKSLILYFSTTRMRHYLEEEKRDRVLFLFKKRKSTLFRQFLYKACSTPKVLKRRQVYNILFCKTSESYGRFCENPTLSCGRI